MFFWIFYIFKVSNDFLNELPECHGCYSSGAQWSAAIILRIAAFC